jgi:hypothetical protein
VVVAVGVVALLLPGAPAPRPARRPTGGASGRGSAVGSVRAPRPAAEPTASLAEGVRSWSGLESSSERRRTCQPTTPETREAVKTARSVAPARRQLKTV